MTGTVEHASPDGAHGAVSFLADEGSGQADCLFSGAAIVAAS